MIVVSTANYYSMLSAATRHALRTGVPLDGKHAVEIEVKAPERQTNAARAASDAAEMNTGHIVDVVV